MKCSKRPPVAYETILKAAREALACVEQWRKYPTDPAWVENQLQYVNQAEALIELLEVHNCGSVKGFDRHGGLIQQNISRYSGNLHGRLDWLEKVR